MSCEKERICCMQLGSIYSKYPKIMNAMGMYSYTVILEGPNEKGKEKEVETSGT